MTDKPAESLKQPVSHQPYDVHKFLGLVVLSYNATMNEHTHTPDYNASQLVLASQGPQALEKILQSPTGCADISMATHSSDLATITTAFAKLCIEKSNDSPYGFDIVPTDNKFKVTIAHDQQTGPAR